MNSASTKADEAPRPAMHAEILEDCTCHDRCDPPRSRMAGTSASRLSTCVPQYRQAATRRNSPNRTCRSAAASWWKIAGVPAPAIFHCPAPGGCGRSAPSPRCPTIAMGRATSEDLGLSGACTYARSSKISTGARCPAHIAERGVGVTKPTAGEHRSERASEERTERGGEHS